MFDKSYLTPSDALSKILNVVSDTEIPTELLKLKECYGRILAMDVISHEDLPAFPRSTVDGYALISQDTFGAKETSPVYINVVNEVFMGIAPDFGLKRGEAAKIPTGGMLPAGADSVLMLEHSQMVNENMIEVFRPVAPNENVIKKGEDIQKGEIILTKGHRLRPQDIGAMAGIGVDEIEVYRKVSVAIISTGDEIVPPDSPMKMGQVRDINSYTLSGLILEHGGIPLTMGIISDDYYAIKKIIEDSLMRADIILISGGTSAGIKDMTATIINDIGKPGVLFHGVSMKPGKPLIGGVLNGKPIFGLPGHPAAVAICFDLFVRPIIEKISGLCSKKYICKTIKAKITKRIPSVSGRQDHIRVFIEERDGEVLATPVLGKSGLITTLVKADGIVVIPLEKLGLNEGEDVIVRLF